MFWLFFIVLIDGIGFGIILPLLPIFVINFKLSSLDLGILAAAFSFFQLLMSPILGALSDRFGRKIIIVICLYVIAFSYELLAYATSFREALIARIIAGMFTGNISVVLASVADLSHSGNRAKYMGIIGAASGLGFMFGPTVGGLLVGSELHNVQFKLVFTVAAIFTASAAFLATCFFKETLDIKVAKLSYKDILLFDRFKTTINNILNNKGVIYLVILSILMWFAFSALYVFLTTWVVIKFSLSPLYMGIITTVFAFFVAVVQIVSTHFIEGGKAILIGFQTAAFAIFALLFNLDIYGIIVVCVFLASALGLLFPNINSAITLQSIHDKGFILGLSQSAGMIGQTLGPLVVGFVYLYSPSYAWLTIGIAFMVSSAITLRYMLADKPDTVK